MIASQALNGKWQHRLFKVIVITSTIAIGIFALWLVALNNSAWIKYSITAFNFESNFTESKGSVVSCKTDGHFSNRFVSMFLGYSPGTDGIPSSVSCGGSPVDGKDIVQKFNETIRAYVGPSVIQRVCTDAQNEQPIGFSLSLQTFEEMDKAVGSSRIAQSVVNTPSGITTKGVACIDLMENFYPISATDFRTGQPTVVNSKNVYDHYLSDAQISFIHQADSNLDTALKAKRAQEIIYPVLIEDLLYTVLAIASWYIFWQVIFYRTLLYVIYGKRR